MFKLIGPASIVIFSIACSQKSGLSQYFSIACSQESDLSQYEIQFVGKTNNGEPLPNVTIVADGKQLGMTDKTGRLSTSLAGSDGQDRSRRDVS